MSTPRIPSREKVRDQDSEYIVLGEVALGDVEAIRLKDGKKLRQFYSLGFDHKLRKNGLQALDSCRRPF